MIPLKLFKKNADHPQIDELKIALRGTKGKAKRGLLNKIGASGRKGPLAATAE